MDSLLFALSHEGFTLKLKRLITEPASTFVLDFALEVWLFIVDHGHCVANIHIQLPYHEVVSAQYWWYDIIYDIVYDMNSTCGFLSRKRWPSMLKG